MGVLSASILGTIVWVGLLASPTAGEQPADKQEPGKAVADLGPHAAFFPAHLASSFAFLHQCDGDCY
jgi:hypothetical protein